MMNSAFGIDHGGFSKAWRNPHKESALIMQQMKPMPRSASRDAETKHLRKTNYANAALKVKNAKKLGLSKEELASEKSQKTGSVLLHTPDKVVAAREKRLSRRRWGLLKGGYLD